jgi:hypothetical protein
MQNNRTTPNKKSLATAGMTNLPQNHNGPLGLHFDVH